MGRPSRVTTLDAQSRHRIGSLDLNLQRVDQRPNHWIRISRSSRYPLRCWYTGFFVFPTDPTEVCVFFSVRELELRKAHFDVAFAPGEIEFFDKLRQASPLTAEGSVELLGNTLGEIRVQGHLSVMMEADCDRCLEPARVPLESDFDLFYRPEPELEAIRDEMEIGEGESQIAFYEGDGLELRDILREHILLSLPMQRVCSEDCKGICPVCGQNRNLVACGCTVKPADDRWAALKNLK
jgi:uncharacterized protein